MNTNSKHYEKLNIQPWEIMERNFTTEEFVAYLKGNIIKYTLRDKGQALTDAQKIKHYAEKLIEVLEKKETDQYEKHRVFECINGKHYELRYIQDNYRRERIDLKFYEVVPKEITKIVYERKEK